MNNLEVFLREEDGFFGFLASAFLGLIGARQAKKERRRLEARDDSRLQRMKADALAAGFNPLSALGAGAASAYGGGGGAGAPLTSLDYLRGPVQDFAEKMDKDRDAKKVEAEEKAKLAKIENDRLRSGIVENRTVRDTSEDIRISGPVQQRGPVYDHRQHGWVYDDNEPSEVLDKVGNKSGNPRAQRLQLPDGSGFHETDLRRESQETLEGEYGEIANIEGAVNMVRERYIPFWGKRLQDSNWNQVKSISDPIYPNRYQRPIQRPDGTVEAPPQKRNVPLLINPELYGEYNERIRKD